MTAIFGPAGNSEDFSKKFKASVNAPKYLHDMGLDAYEYQCGRGVNIGDETAADIGAQAKANGIKMSLHAPYFINLSSSDDERVTKSINYILGSCHAAKCMGAARVIVHCGGLTGQTRESAMENTLSTLQKTLAAMAEQGYNGVTLCIETMGKLNVLGTADEVLHICKSDERLLPCIDFGHLNARTNGGMSTYEDFTALFDAMENALGLARARIFHSHFSKIEYTKMGELRHLTFEDLIFGPDFIHAAKIMAARDYGATIICESAGTQSQDALAMKNMYLKALNP